MSEWLPIETAPKEIILHVGYSKYGRNILLTDGYEVVRGRWWEMAESDESNFISDGGFSFHATHWMHLPEPPK